MSNITELSRQYDEAVKKVSDTAEKYSPLRVKAEYIGCKGCGSRLAKRYVKFHFETCKCPLCGTSLFSKTASERIQNAKLKADQIRSKLEEEERKEEEKSKPSFAEALADTRNRLDYILEEHKTPDFIEIIGKVGGDTLTFRVYRDGSVYER